MEYYKNRYDGICDSHLDERKALYERIMKEEEERARRRVRRKKLAEKAALLIVILFVLYVFLGGLNGVGPLDKHLDKHDDHVQFNEPVQELPESGLLTAPYNDEILARFLVHAGETQKHFLLKLINVEDYSLEPMLIFIRQGESKEVAVPLGVYRLKYCTGNVWYGDEHLFGPSTNYYEKPELLEFYAEDSYVHGIELTMTYVPDGDGGLKETKRKFW